MGKILEALDKAGALFEVEKRRPVDPVTFEGVPGFAQITNKETNEVYGYTGSEYELIDHRQAFSGVDSSLPELEAKYGPATVHAEAYAKRQRGTKALLVGKTADVRVEFRSHELGRDGLFPSLQLTHGIAGEASLTAQGGVFRLVCTNGMTIGKRELIRRLRHTSGIRYRLEGMEALVHRAIDEAMSVEAAMQAGRQHKLRNTDEETGALYYVLTGNSLSSAERRPRRWNEFLADYFAAPGAAPGTLNGVLQAATFRATHQQRNALRTSVQAGADRLRTRATNLIHAASEEGSVERALLALTTLNTEGK